MEDLSICQEYLLCTLNEKGKLPLSSEAHTCFIAGCLLDLMLSHNLSIDEKKKLCIIGELKSGNMHIAPLYNFISNSKPMKIDKLAIEYGFSDKKINLVIDKVGTSLAEKGCVTPKSVRKIHKRTLYLPKEDSVDRVIQKIRAELLEDGELSDNTIALATLLDKSRQLKDYFSKYEKQQLRDRLKELKNTPSNKIVKEMVDTIDAIILALVAVYATV